MSGRGHNNRIEKNTFVVCILMCAMICDTLAVNTTEYSKINQSNCIRVHRFYTCYMFRVHILDHPQEVSLNAYHEIS
jgi:hypothetical protein